MGFLILDYNTWPEPRWQDGAAPVEGDAAKVGGVPGRVRPGSRSQNNRQPFRIRSSAVPRVVA